MDYCTNCGNAIDHPNFKFCGNCGSTISEIKSKNNIDENYKKIERNIASVQKEFHESETVNRITKKVDKVSYKIMQFFGVISIIIVAILFLNPIITGNDFIIKSAFESNINVIGLRRSYAGFLGEILILIIPLILILIIDNKVIKNLTILLMVGLFFYTLLLFNS